MNAKKSDTAVTTLDITVFDVAFESDKSFLHEAGMVMFMMFNIYSVLSSDRRLTSLTISTVSPLHNFCVTFLLQTITPFVALKRLKKFA